jgi:hypothetical protein
MALSRKPVQAAAGAMALSDPGTKPALGGSEGGRAGPPLSGSATPNWVSARPGCGGQVWSEDSVSVRVMKNQQDPAQA